MNSKTRILATLVGAIVLFLSGWLFYGILLRDFFASNTGSVANAMRPDEEMVMWALFLGNVFQAYLLVYVFGKLGTITTFGDGFKNGAVLGLIVALGIDLIMYATSNTVNLTAALVDPLVVMIMMGITGGIIGVMSGKK